MKFRSIMIRRVPAVSCGLALCGFMPAASAGPYSGAMNDPANTYDAPIPGFVGPNGIGKARMDTFTVDGNGDPIYQNSDNLTNPLFFAWAQSVTDYQRSDSDLPFNDPSLALGAVTGDVFDVVALGELNSAALIAGNPPGSITIELARPVRNLTGADFVIFENGVIAQTNYGGAGIGGIFGELAYVEVSTNGVDFVRFPSASLTPAAVGGYGSIDPTNAHNLAGKHVNGYGDSWGTPFDLSDVGLSQITHIRLVDVPGNGSFLDSSGRPIRDPWVTFGSGGFDLEAVGAVSTTMTFAEWPLLASSNGTDPWPQLKNLSAADRLPGADPDGDGVPNLLEYAFSTVPWKPDAVTPTLAMVDGRGEISFTRDERLADLVYEVQTSATMAPDDWITIASSTDGAPMQEANGYAPVISEISANAIQSIGVIRKVTVRDTVAGPHRFLRVKVSTIPASLPNP